MEVTPCRPLPRQFGATDATKMATMPHSFRRPRIRQIPVNFSQLPDPHSVYGVLTCPPCHGKNGGTGVAMSYFVATRCRLETTGTVWRRLTSHSSPRCGKCFLPQPEALA